MINPKRIPKRTTRDHFNFDQITDDKMFNICFSKNNGFGLQKNNAIKLMKFVLDVLNEFDIDYFLISGTLLGYVRHNDLIPWDDDLDIIVDSSFVEKVELIASKYTHITVMKEWETVYKIYFNDAITIPNITKTHKWPFIDLFIFNKMDCEIKFFNKMWDITKFYPAQLVQFVGIENVKIPRDPHYFLYLNYSLNVLDVYVSSIYDHKSEFPKPIFGTVSAKKYDEIIGNNKELLTIIKIII